MSEEKQKVEIKVVTPVNGLEHAIDQARNGALPVPDFLRILGESSVCVPISEPRDAVTGGIKPYFFNKEGAGMMLIYSDEGLLKTADMPIEHAVELTMREVVSMLSPKFGFVMNPGLNLCFDMNPPELAEIYPEN